MDKKIRFYVIVFYICLVMIFISIIGLALIASGK